MARRPIVHFRLKKPPIDGVCTIYLEFIYNTRRLYYSFGQSVKITEWNEKKERVKNTNKTTKDGKYALNELLDHLEKLCVRTYLESLKDGIPKPSVLKDALQGFVDKNHHNIHKSSKPTLFTLAEKFIKGEIKNKGKDKSKGSLDNYNAVTKHLKDYQTYSKSKVDFDTIDLEFFYSYVSYLKDKKKLAINSIAKDISIIKVFMGEAVDLEYTDNMKFKHKKFSFVEEETEHVYLTEAELTKLFKLKISNKKLDEVRDLFLFGAWVGLRFSDFSNVKFENIVHIEGDYFIKMVTQKTKELVIIPCNNVVLEIFEKYKDRTNLLPKTISNQKFNEYIKEVCKLAAFDEKGRLASKPKEELYSLISSHTARRSFATNYYLQGFPTLDLMKITGHKTEKSFLKYIRVSKLDTAMRLSAHIKTRWNEKLNKIIE
jgi:integrase